MLRRAVERELEIIGEATRRLLEFDDFSGITAPEKIIGFRNKIAHGYDIVEDELVWGIIINHLPVLKKEVESLLNKE